MVIFSHKNKLENTAGGEVYEDLKLRKRKLYRIQDLIEKESEFTTKLMFSNLTFSVSVLTTAPQLN